MAEIAIHHNNIHVVNLIKFQFFVVVVVVAVDFFYKYKLTGIKKSHI
jgi:hypothetical protein